ncbi:MAG TPA: phosphate ABC transporter permease subunit PstC [Candidatus Deferrimicrobium sp.]|nr:phosphate ABC transporter permease subunit PstC [Candidatus Deferrimicrobium sp.]
MTNFVKAKKSIYVSKGTGRTKRLSGFLMEGSLFIVTSVSMIAVIFILLFIARDALPFFKLRGIKEFLFSIRWYPSGNPAEFGALAIIFGSAMVTFLSTLVAVPLAIFSAASLSDILPFSVRQVVKPVIEIIAAIPSVAYGFFALVVFAPLLQRSGGHLLGISVWLTGIPLSLILTYILSETLANKLFKNPAKFHRTAILIILEGVIVYGLYKLYTVFTGLVISSGANALNVSIILAIMALPTIVSVSEDALQAVGRELREGSYALGATRAETLVKVIIPAAKSGIIAAIILGVMRALGETMLVWMASGNAAQIPQPWYDVFQPIRTLTATIAGDMGEADHVTGSARYHVLFAMALLLLLFSLISNFISEWLTARSKKKWGV